MRKEIDNNICAEFAPQRSSLAASDFYRAFPDVPSEVDLKKALPYALALGAAATTASTLDARSSEVLKSSLILAGGLFAAGAAITALYEKFFEKSGWKETIGSSVVGGFGFAGVGSMVYGLLQNPLDIGEWIQVPPQCIGYYFMAKAIKDE